MVVETPLSDDSDAMGDVFSSDRPERTGQQPRDDAGRFAQKVETPTETFEKTVEVEAAEKPVAVVETAEPAKTPSPTDPSHRVPLSEVLAERKQRQEQTKAREEAEARAQRLEQQVADLIKLSGSKAGQEAAPEAPKAPDFYENPEGFIASQLQQIEWQRRNDLAHLSERRAIKAHGKEVVDAAYEAAKAAGLSDQFARSPDPYDDLVEWHSKAKAFAEVGDDPKAFESRIREQVRAEVLAELKAGGPGAAAAASKFPQSLASATAQGEQGAQLTVETAMAQVFDSGRNRRA